MYVDNNKSRPLILNLVKVKSNRYYYEDGCKTIKFRFNLDADKTLAKLKDLLLVSLQKKFYKDVISEYNKDVIVKPIEEAIEESVAESIDQLIDEPVAESIKRPIEIRNYQLRTYPEYNAKAFYDFLYVSFPVNSSLNIYRLTNKYIDIYRNISSILDIALDLSNIQIYTSSNRYILKIEGKKCAYISTKRRYIFADGEYQARLSYLNHL
jgi:hypothetical protein